MSNRIIVPANYTFEVILKVDPTNGQSEMQIRNRSNIQVTMWQVVGLLVEHTATLTKTLLSGKNIQRQPITEPEQQTEPLKSVGGGGEHAT